MSGIPIVGKVFKLLDDIPILKVAAVAAIVYFTAGAASGAFSGAGASTAAAGGTASATTAANVGAASAASGVAAGTTAATTAASAATVGATAVPAAVAAAAPAAATSWFAANPMATMMLGQGVLGAASGYEADKAEEEAAAERERVRKERGLFGFDYEGKPGVVSTAMQEPSPQIEGQRVQAAQTPVVASQQVGADQPAMRQQAPTVTPVQKKDLPKLNQAGQLAIG